jgi:hypothetical protein
MNRNKIQEILEFEDWDAPLTDEAFEELGFWKDEMVSGNWFKDVDNIYTDALESEFNLLIFGNSENQEAYLWEIGDRKCSPKWKTVGSVKMLIEALKGDE